jgi:ureidoglycolate lyase
MTKSIFTEPLTATAFAPFGEVLEARGTPDKMINQGLCGRFHDRAKLDFGASLDPSSGGGRAGISIFQAQPRSLPYTLDLVERHPDGSQAFLPMSEHPFLVIVTTDPSATPRAFLTNGAQGINLHRGTWHGVLTPLSAPGLFAVVDRIGTTLNLQEHQFSQPWTVYAQATTLAEAQHGQTGPLR